MDIIVKSYNAALNHNNYISPIARGYQGNSMLQNYIAARLTNRQTIRILLEQEHLEQEENAIAAQIADRIIKTVESAFK